MFSAPIDPQLELFDGDRFWQLPEPEPEPVEVLAPQETTASTNWPQLGFDNRERGKATERAFFWEIQGLGGTTSLPPDDPAGGTRSDIWVKFPYWETPITVQVRSAVLRNGRARFRLGEKEGSQAGREQRRDARYYGRANLFALAVYDETDKIIRWYLIPAKYLRLRKTLSVTPGRYARRRRKDGIEPERFSGENVWLRLADEAKSPLQGILSRQVSPAGDT